MNSKKLYIYSFYSFFDLKNKKKLKSDFDIFLSNKIVRGTILLADEGINATISGNELDLKEIMNYLEKKIEIRNLNLKKIETDFLPFNRMKVRLKKEIVSLGKGNINIKKYGGELVDPSNWNSLIKSPDTLIIDVRNSFEICIGSFNNALNLKTKSFRDFSKQFKKLNVDNKKKIAMYCTGGIRCEKASAYLKINGYENVFQLNGGIINYLKYVKENNTKTEWTGECFVFDNRVTIDKYLKQGKYHQCFGCRRPITKEEVQSKFYKKGVHCPHCFNKRTSDQLKRSESRQKQIDRFKNENTPNTFSKIKQI